MNEIYSFLREQNLSEALIRALEDAAAAHPVPEKARERAADPPIPFYGKETLEAAIAALLEGQNLLLVGAKATGKNVLAENLARLFSRPVYNVSFHVSTGSAELIGTDTFRGGEVRLRKGIITECAEAGGFGILDEINMAKSDAVAVLHATLDQRRVIDVPGYERIRLHPATRFVATMNYGYAGTKELNEALVSRFLVIEMPPQTEETLAYVLGKTHPDLSPAARDQLIGLFLDLQEKAAAGEITSRAIDLRGLVAAVGTVRRGLSARAALAMGLSNKCFDPLEREIVGDVLASRVPENWDAAEIFA